MKEYSKRWHTVTMSNFDHEKEGLKALAEVIRDKPHYRVWTNFEFSDTYGESHEVDALVVGRRRIHLVELKHWSGWITGDDHNLYVTSRSGRIERRPNPVNLARKKAKRLVSRLNNEFKRLQREDPQLAKIDARVPWVQECVIFTNPRSSFHDLDKTAQANLFGLDHHPGQHGSHQGLPGMSERLLEAPTTGESISEELISKLIEPAMNKIAGVSTKTNQLHAWVLGELQDTLDSVRYFSAHHVDDEKIKAYLRVVELDPNAPNEVYAREESIQRREYAELRSLNNPNIDSPSEFFREANLLVTVFPRAGGQFNALDQLPRNVCLNASQQVQIIEQMASALHYAHQNNILHRNLGPNSVLLNTDALRTGSISTLVSGWTAFGRLPNQQQRALTQTVSPQGSTLFDNSYDTFWPPEGYTEQSDGRLGDLFSLGAMAYFILSGGKLPATNRLKLIEKLRSSEGLDLAETGREVEEPLRALIKGVTHPYPKERAKAVRRPHSSHDEDNPVLAFLHRLQEVTGQRRIEDLPDPVNPPRDALINGRFQVDEVLGAGSTARGLLVTDRDDPESPQRVLKVALDKEKHSRLDAEATTLRELHDKLPASTKRNRFVELIAGPLSLQRGRYGLLLSQCGNRTLADVLSNSSAGERQLWSLGGQLLEILASLEDTGVLHRDIKPSNIGVSGKPSQMRLSLFDFSLSSEPLDAIEAGTPQYRDPFLGARRPRFDRYAERYAAVVVLYQLATREFPLYAPDGTLPALTEGELYLPDDAFLDALPYRPDQAAALATFFRQNLSADITRRAESAQQLLKDFRAIEQLPAPAMPQPPRVTPTAPVPPPEATSTPDNPAPITSLKELIGEIRAHAGPKRSQQQRFVSYVLGEHENAPEDAFAPDASYAAKLQVDQAKIPAIASQVYEIWAETPALRRVYADLVASLRQAIDQHGGIATPLNLADVVSQHVAADLFNHAPRALMGVVRLVQLSVEHDPAHATYFLPLRREQNQVLVALANPPGFGSLHHDLERAAVEAVTASPSGIVPASEFDSLLHQAAAESLGIAASEVQLNAALLPELATQASQRVALTATGDAYSRTMTAEQLIAAVFPRTAERVDRSLLTELIATRFPAAHVGNLPEHPALDAIVQRHNPSLVYDATRSGYLIPREDDSAYVNTRVPTSTATTRGLAEDFDELAANLAGTIEDRQFRFVATPLGSADAVAQRLADTFEVPHVDVTAAVLTKLAEAATSQEELMEVLAADTPENHRMMGQMLRAWSQEILDEALSTATDAVILSDISILVSYDNQDLIERYLDITERHASCAVWAVIPQEENSAVHGLVIEGHNISLSSTNQLVRA